MIALCLLGYLAAMVGSVVIVHRAEVRTRHMNAGVHRPLDELTPAERDHLTCIEIAGRSDAP